jgi:hypothetical protein
MEQTLNLGKAKIVDNSTKIKDIEFVAEKNGIGKYVVTVISVAAIAISAAPVVKQDIRCLVATNRLEKSPSTIVNSGLPSNKTGNKTNSVQTMSLTANNQL